MWKKSDVEFVVETNSEIIAASQKLFLGLSCSNFHLIAALKSQSQTSSLTSCDINGWSWHKETGKRGSRILAKMSQHLLFEHRTNFMYRVIFLTVPSNFQYQNEKRWAANQRVCSMKFSMYKRSSLVEQRFSF